MFERIKHMLIKEFIQIFRDPRMKAVIFLMPIVQALVFGYAVTTDVKHVPIAVYDLDNSAASRELAAQFVTTEYFDVRAHVGDDATAQRLVDHGEVQAVLRFNHGFEADLRGGRTAHVQLIVDGTDSNTAGVVLAYAAEIVGRFSNEALLSCLSRLGGGASPEAPLSMETRAWFNENLESRNFYVPGVIAILVMLITLMLTSMAVVREKEVGTMEQIMVTPITSGEFILGKTVPFALIGFADVLIITFVAVFWFEVPIRGNLLLLLVATALYIMTTLGIGLLISTLSATQQQAMMSTFFFYFPAVLLSGFMFPIANMPQGIQWLTYANPLRYFLVIIRGIFLKGVGPSALWPQMAVLLFMGVATLWFAASRFKKTTA
ncbi:MAG TPA: ABC transporter permease [Candidatus Hydrogenedentes bacterium]|nr:ABC transporter permease [Candidatus Hydrogenedentota bacterium]